MKIVIIGHGGHSKVICDSILSQNEFEVVGYLDDKYKDVKRIGNIYYGPISSAKRLIDYFIDIKFIIAIGNNQGRKQIVDKLNLSENYFVTLIHKSAVVSQSSKIGIGTVVMPNSVINAESQIGNHAIINTGAIIEHDCIVGDFIHVSPAATLTGAVHLEEGVSVGAGAIIIPNIKIGEWSIIGAGATVISHIPSYCTAVGIPAKVNKVNEDGGELIAK